MFGKLSLSSADSGTYKEENYSLILPEISELSVYQRAKQLGEEQPEHLASSPGSFRESLVYTVCACA